MTRRGITGTRGTPFRITTSIGPLVVLLLTVGCGQLAPDVRDDAPAGLPSPTSGFAHQEGFATSGPPVRVEGPTPVETVAWPAMTPSPSRRQPPALPPPAGSGVQGTVHGNPTCPSWCGEPSISLIATVEVRNMETGALVATGRSGEGGEFRIAVSPGDYTLRAIPHHEVGGPERALRLSYSCQETRVRVETDRYTEAPIECYG